MTGASDDSTIQSSGSAMNSTEGRAGKRTGRLSMAKRGGFPGGMGMPGNMKHIF